MAAALSLGGQFGMIVNFIPLVYGFQNGVKRHNRMTDTEATDDLSKTFSIHDEDTPASN